jgi:hypothetical protein
MLVTDELERHTMSQSQRISSQRVHDQRGEEDTPAHHWLRPARALWIAVVVPAYALWIAQLPAYVSAVRHDPTADAAPGASIALQLGLADLRRLDAWGLSLDVYAGAIIALTLLFQLTYAAVGLLLFWRRANDRMAYFASFALMLLPFAFAPLTLGALPPAWRWIIPAIAALGNASLILCGYLFPDGRFTPGWIRVLAALLVVYALVAAILPSMQLDRSELSLLIMLGFALSVLPVQIYRYRAVSTPYQRQQTKWVVLGIAVGVVGNIAARTLHVVVLIPVWGANALAFGAQVGLVMLAMLAIPLAVGTAILSSHLWDIDIVIHRTVLYSTLSALLAGIYAATVVVLQALIHPFTGLQAPGPLVITISTLLVAAVTNPLRRWLQGVIDRRFYRRTYQRERVLTAFARTLHNEVELSQLRHGLLSVIDETMQPTHLSLWLLPAAEGTPHSPSDRQRAAGEPPGAA